MTTPTTPAAEVSRETIIEALDQYTRGDEHQRAIEAAIDALKTATARESALVAERDALRAAMKLCLENVQAADRDKPFTDPDMCGAMVKIRLTGLVALVEALNPGSRDKVLQGLIDGARSTLAAPAVEG